MTDAAEASPPPSCPRGALVSTTWTPTPLPDEVVETQPAAGHDDRVEPAVAALTGNARSIVTLLAWLSPAFPVGGYAYSHGLEQAVEDGDVNDEASLEAWLGDGLGLGFGRNDAILLFAAHQATTECDHSTLGEVNELALAFAPTRELHLETSQQGRSFLDAVSAAWPNAPLAACAEALPGPVAYPVAVGAAAAAHGLPAQETAAAFLVAVTQSLVSAAVRLAPIGQTAGARIVARLNPLARALAAEAAASTVDDLSTSTFRLDLSSARHETQYTRLFRS